MASAVARPIHTSARTFSGVRTRAS
jgi:hypothetical protein